MLTYVFEASSLLRFLDNEAGADRVKELLNLSRNGVCHAEISAVHWGEMVSTIARKRGLQHVAELSKLPAPYHLNIIPATADRAHRAGLIKFTQKIPYADAFAVELASDSPDHILITADFDMKPAENDIQIEFLPTKQTP
ncbi:PIN domain-containing protein [Granulicella tundricola]|uniref:PIN domain-containing protein n=1 Tax=Granulicella tundricola (strain ATCC BAA-1859 / DSM 23138 / MP5ACTX9) TaxID=1198114 RepID=E8X4H4_GRATM|nr:PIN domain-containing protein [Granulicella tundricola]ADW68301.1 hypothetical protein AciX9_1238 [Granulicella tundricola MP5ACTX9]